MKSRFSLTMLGVSQGTKITKPPASYMMLDFYQINYFDIYYYWCYYYNLGGKSLFPSFHWIQQEKKMNEPKRGWWYALVGKKTCSARRTSVWTTSTLIKSWAWMNIPLIPQRAGRGRKILTAPWPVSQVEITRSQFCDSLVSNQSEWQWKDIWHPSLFSSCACLGPCTHIRTFVKCIHTKDIPTKTIL